MDIGEHVTHLARGRDCAGFYSEMDHNRWYDRSRPSVAQTRVAETHPSAVRGSR